jgi:hypothetical protein
MATTQAVPRVRPSLRVSFRTRPLALVALIAVAATVLALGLSNSAAAHLARRSTTGSCPRRSRQRRTG